MSAGQGVLTRIVGLEAAVHLGDARQVHHLQPGPQPAPDAAGQRHAGGGGGVVCQETQDCQYKVGFNLLSMGLFLYSLFRRIWE